MSLECRCHSNRQVTEWVIEIGVPEVEVTVAVEVKVIVEVMVGKFVEVWVGGLLCHVSI